MFQGDGDLKRVLIIGENDLTYDYVKLISSLSNMKIIAIVKEKEQFTKVDALAKQLQMKTSDSLHTLAR